MCQIRRFHTREDVEWEAEEDSDTEEEEENSESEEKNGQQPRRAERKFAVGCCVRDSW